MTKLYYLLGKPVSHSISPLFWNETFNKIGMDAVYNAVEIEPEDIKAAIRGLEILKASGANITIPHKQSVAECCAELHGAAIETGVVNTIVPDKNGSHGWNTDFSGLLGILNGIGKINSALVIGSGASSKTALRALKAHGCINISQIARKFSDNYSGEKQNYVIKLSWNKKNFVYSLTKSDIIINTTPIGWKSDDNIPGFAEGLSKDKVFLDFNYSKVSQLIAVASEKKCRVINGLELLLRQAMDSFRIFFDDEPPEKIMREAVYKYTY